MVDMDDIVAGAAGLPGIERLNAMQAAMAADDSRRVMLTAPTGSGKTVAFALRMLREVAYGSAEGAGVLGVVLAPSRELVIQIGSVVRRLPGAGRVATLYGGHDFATETNELKGGAAVIVATPGRLLDHINRGGLSLRGVRCVVVDEFDKCLELGFRGEMERIFRSFDGGKPDKSNKTVGADGACGGGQRLETAASAVVVLTSATRGVELPGFVGRGTDFRRYDYGEGATAPVGVTEVVEVVSPSRDKLATLLRIVGNVECGMGNVEFLGGGSSGFSTGEQEDRRVDGGRMIVFVNHRESAERVFGFLEGEGVPAVLYHGGLDQQRRRMAVELLANGTRRVMVATDLAARGLDISGIEAVVHYHLPSDVATWTHRNGRTGRQGAPGLVYAIVSEGEGLPEGVVADRRVEGSELRAVCRLAAERATLYINAGRKEKISKGDVAGYVMKQGGLDRGEVGRIMVDDHYAMVAVPAGMAQEVAARLGRVKLKGRRVRVSVISN